MTFYEWLGWFIYHNAWPTVVLVVLIAVLAAPWVRFAIKDLLSSFGIRRLKFSGTEIEFGKDDKLIIQSTIDESVVTIEKYRLKVDKNVKRLVRKTGLNTAFVEAAGQLFQSQFGKRYGTDDLRATIHVQDFVFEDRLYQVLDYYPAGDGAFRHFSSRRGIIGRVWRSQIGASAGFLTKKVAPKPLPIDEKLVDDICLEWGLTRPEAYDFKKRPSYCCVPIIRNHRILGVFYIDSTEPNFGWQDSPGIESKLNALEAVLKRCIWGGWPGSDVIPNGCRSQFGEPHVDADHPAAA